MYRVFIRLTVDFLLSHPAIASNIAKDLSLLLYASRPPLRSRYKYVTPFTCYFFKWCQPSPAPISTLTSVDSSLACLLTPLLLHEASAIGNPKTGQRAWVCDCVYRSWYTEPELAPSPPSALFGYSPRVLE